MFRRIVTPLLTLAALVAADATAEAKVFRGKTSQGRPASVVVGTDNLVRTARIRWRPHCPRGRWVEGTAFRRPHDISTVDSFHDSGTYRLRAADGFRLRITTTIRGTRIFDPANPSAERWRGRFWGKILVTRGGRYYDTCRLRNVRWRARLVD